MTSSSAVARQVFLDDALSVQLRTVDLPDLEPGQVRVRVLRAGVNFWEAMQRRGRVPLPPNRGLGLEGVGIVEEVGAGVTRLSAGQRVAWSRVPGSYANTVVAAEAAFVAVPDLLSDATAAALLFQGVTAHYLCHDVWTLREGDTAVVTAAAGGVGVLLTQLLVARGVQVIAVVSRPEKADVAVVAGADRVLTYDDALTEEIRSEIPGGVAVVYDAVGAGVAESLLGALRPCGAMVLFGAASGREADISAGDLTRASLFLTRAAGRDYVGDDAAVAARSNLLFTLASQGVVQPVVGREFSLSDAAMALDSLESRSTTGKQLLVP